jgi:HD-GYP domain-containing protein (c-di-GMP phosphodiesterase class II)
VDLILRDDVLETDLLGVMHHDYHTFTHSANVSYYSVMLASSLQLADEHGLKQIATGALLHDLGKLDIPDHILCKPGRLSDSEFEIIRDHPRTGFRKLCHRDDLSSGQLMMVYQHHERLDGKGYPVGITAEEIHPWGRVCTVADVFEALTSNRPYRKGMSVEQAFDIMDRDSGLAFDIEMLKCWKEIIQRA